MSATQDEASETDTPIPPVDDAPLSDSIYESAYLPEDMPGVPNIQASLYHSAIDPFQEPKEELSFVDSEGVTDETEVGGAKERKQRKSLICRERQFCAQLAINEVLLSISSRGKCSVITCVVMTTRYPQDGLSLN